MRGRTLLMSRGTYDEMNSTRRFLVIDDDQLRADVIAYYSGADGKDGAAEWVSDASSMLAEVLEPTGMTPFDYSYIENSLPNLRDLEGLGLALRNVRWRSLRYVYVIESVEDSAEQLTVAIEEYLAVE